MTGSLRGRRLAPDRQKDIFIGVVVFLAVVVPEAFAGSISILTIVVGLFMGGLAGVSKSWHTASKKRQRRLVRLKRIAPFCRDCDYDLRGLDANRCPECQTLVPKKVHQRWSDASRASGPHAQRLVDEYLRLMRIEQRGFRPTNVVLAALFIPLFLLVFLRAMSSSMPAMWMSVVIVVAVITIIAVVTWLNHLRKAIES